MRAHGGNGGLAPLEAAESHLRECQLCWLATNGPHGLTCCTLYYALPEPWCLLVMSSERPRHVANLKTDSACSVCVPRLPSFFGEPARQLTARCDGFPAVDSLRVDADAELFYARYPVARGFVDQVKSMREEAELVPMRLRLLGGEYLDEERYGVENVAVIDAFPSCV
jgi:Pyridoxamine 5'-phosphate oxidase